MSGGAAAAALTASDNDMCPIHVDYIKYYIAICTRRFHFLNED